MENQKGRRVKQFQYKIGNESLGMKQADDDVEFVAEEVLRRLEEETGLTATEMIDLANMQDGVGLTETLKREVRAYCDRHCVNYGAALAYLIPNPYAMVGKQK